MDVGEKQLCDETRDDNDEYFDENIFNEDVFSLRERDIAVESISSSSDRSSVNGI
jgi:hypothetical protein